MRKSEKEREKTKNSTISCPQEKEQWCGKKEERKEKKKKKRKREKQRRILYISKVFS